MRKGLGPFLNIGCLILFCLVTRDGLCKDANDNETMDLTPLAKNATTKATSNTPLNAVGSTRPGLQIIESTQGGSAAIKATAFNTGHVIDKEYSSNPITLTLSVPTNGASHNFSSFQTPLTLKGLTSSSYAQLQYTHLSSSGFNAALAKVSNICTAIITSKSYASDNSKYAKEQAYQFIISLMSKAHLKDKKQTALDIQEFLEKKYPEIPSLLQKYRTFWTFFANKPDKAFINNHQELKTYIKQHGSDIATFIKKHSVITKLSVANLDCRQDLDKHGGPKLYNYIDATAPKYSSFGISARYGYKQFKNVVVDASSSGIISQNKFPWSIGVFGGKTFFNTGAFVTVSVNYADMFKPGNATVICPEMPPGAQEVTCNSGLMSPKESKSMLYAIDIRRAVNYGFLGGWSATITYDQKQKKFGIDVPIYFTGYDGNANYGIDIGYQNEKSPFFVLSIFAGTNFNFFGGH